MKNLILIIVAIIAIVSLFVATNMAIETNKTSVRLAEMGYTRISANDMLRQLEAEEQAKANTPPVSAEPTPEEIRLERLEFLLSLPMQREIACLQKNLYFEARDQSTQAQISVAWVTLNRVTSSRYPSTICEVVYQGVTDKNGNPIRNKCQFSWYCDGKSDNPNHSNKIEKQAWETSEAIALLMVKSCVFKLDDACPEDPTDGALHYHAKTVNPKWSEVYTRSATVGDHHFYTSG